MELALSSSTLSTAKIYDAADTILAQRLSRADGVAQVLINGADKPAIRVRLDPVRLAAAGLSGQDVYNAIRGTNVLAPLGGFQTPDTAETIGLNGQISQAEELAPLIVRSSASGTVRLSGRRQGDQRQRGLADRRVERHATRRAADDQEGGRRQRHRYRRRHQGAAAAADDSGCRRTSRSPSSPIAPRRSAPACTTCGSRC